MTSRAKGSLSALRLEIERHPAVNHIFLHRCATSPFSREDYRVFGENHFPIVCLSASCFEGVIRRAPDGAARQRLEESLHHERGGARGEDARALYERFLRAAGSPVPEEVTFRVPRPAYRFIREIQRIVTKEPFLVALGATAPISAWATPRMFASIVPGLRRAGFSEEEIRYFTRSEREDEARGAAIEAALLDRSGPGDAGPQIRRGALLCLDAYSELWTGTQSAVVRYRQPRAARPDGPRPRSAIHEILLTAWDGLRAAQILERKLVEREERARPTLAELLFAMEGT